MTDFFPQPIRGCARCKGLGFIVEPRGTRAEASVCECIADCELCNGTGWRTVSEGSSKKIGRCICRKLPDRVHLFNHANIPARHSVSDLINFKPVEGATLSLISAQSWLQQFEPGKPTRGLVLWGPVGRGKTHLMIAILRELIFKHGIRVRFIEFSRLLGILKAGYSEGRSNAALLDELVTVPVLGIDELGKGRLTDWELAIIDELISRRYDAMGVVMGTTNYRPAAPTGAPPPNMSMPDFKKQTLGDRVGDRVFSRLQETCVFAETRGADFRTLRRRTIN